MRLGRLFILFGILVCAGQAYSQGSNEEFRSTWVITWNHSSSSYTPAQGKARIRTILDNHKAANMNAVLWQARQSGTAYYNSSFEPWGYYVGGSDPGYDPLAYAIQEAHKRGLEVHAWFNAFHTSSDAAGTPVGEHPEWVCRDGYGNPMTSNYAISPGLEEVREYTLDVAMEIVNNYDIDGLHLDYIRWNEYTNSSQSEAFARTAREQQFLDGMITPEQVAELQEAADRDRYLYDPQHPYSDGVPAGFDSWEDWWRWSVTTFVQSLHDSMQSVKPWVRLSVAALGNYRWGGWQGYGTVYQDAALWFNEGYIDQLTPMHYHWDTGSGFYGMLTGNGSESWEYWITDGINDGRLYSVGPGSYNFDNWNSHPSVVNRSRDVSWTDGFQFFSYGTWEDYDYWEEAGVTFFSRKTKIRGSGLIVDQTPATPTLDLTQGDSLTYNISVAPASELSAPQWFAVYRSRDNTLSVDTDTIIDIQFSDTAFSVTENFTGLQDFDGQYTYYATMLDRYWNESGISDTSQTGDIPSFAPVVLESYPVPGDTIPVSTELSLAFSKTMDTLSVNQALSLNSVAFETHWSDDQHTVQLLPEESLGYDTEYTLEISAAATDINNTPIDGNADGNGGDVFTLTFYTEQQDVTGPQVMVSRPGTGDFGFDLDNVITLVFDEKVDPESVTDEDITLSTGTDQITSAYNISDINGKSVLSVQAPWRLSQNTQYELALAAGISDTLGNSTTSEYTLDFTSSEYGYAETQTIAQLSSTSSWWDPENSGSTTGTSDPGTYIEISTAAFLPKLSGRDRKSFGLHYEWIPDAEEHLLRTYLSGGSPREMLFDTTYTMQVYIFGDGSGTQFRFAVDDGTSASASAHEVSEWIPIDWLGWKLVEWELSDPNSFGEWLGNMQFDSPNSLRYDSFQLQYTGESAITGTLHLYDLRLVKKTTEPVLDTGDESHLPKTLSLAQNYPNPFNPVTNIGFTLPENGEVQLVVYDISGHIVQVLKNGHMQAGRYVVPFDGSSVSSGIYFYQLKYNGKQSTRRMALIK